MSDRYVPPPPPYELSLQRDQKISEELQLLELSTKPPIEDKDDGECEESKDSKALAQKAFVEASIQPLRIQKRSGAANSNGLRGPRPLPPSPADACARNARWPQHGPRTSPELHAKDPVSAPPPFTPLGPSLDGPPYEQTFSHRTTSGAPSPLPNLPQSLPDGPRHWHNNRRPQSSWASAESTPGPAAPPTKSHRMRLAFDPSVAYVNSNTDQWDAVFERQTVSAASLYSSAVSSHLHPSAAASRNPHM
ncbi:hypothetical protein F5I97DRAFT_882150 [Phlebopus sp. FC_14]|nr:hypothetical protein F5I97DRAFT_882150 [Phlebopus sp. FC_14]